jgi:putative membrane protein
MYTVRRFSKRQIFNWTLKDVIFFTIVSTTTVAVFFFFDLRWLAIPTLPISLLGTAVAFNVGFKNNNAYDRSWEARKIYGGIINSSRTLGIMTLDFITNLFNDSVPATEDELYTIKKRIIYRHIAWLTALRYQLRAHKPWEHHEHKDVAKHKIKNGNYIAEQVTPIKDVISEFLSVEERDDVLSRPNPATSLLKNQSRDITALRHKDLMDDFRYIEFKNIIEEFYTLQGKNERIKNFPLPRQYASVSYYFVMLFVLLIPFAMLNFFVPNSAEESVKWSVWLAVPLSVVVQWVFFTMEKTGDYSENPYEGISNDVPITALSKTIEIDLRDMLDEKELPKAIKAWNGAILT